LEILGKKGCIKVLEALKDGKKRRYKDLFILTSLPSATLSTLLKDLVILGLVKKDVENRPGRILIEYQITQKGKEVIKLLEELEKLLEEVPS
jgi:DNA-binding HxlR family transcriptional regulator